MLEEGLACGLHRIERLMRIMFCGAKTRGKPQDDGDGAPWAGS
jgi:putative transposase